MLVLFSEINQVFLTLTEIELDINNNRWKLALADLRISHHKRAPLPVDFFLRGHNFPLHRLLDHFDIFQRVSLYHHTIKWNVISFLKPDLRANWDILQNFLVQVLAVVTLFRLCVQFGSYQRFHVPNFEDWFVVLLLGWQRLLVVNESWEHC